MGNEFAMVERFALGKLCRVGVDVGIGPVFQCPDFLYVRDAGAAYVRYSECDRADAIRLADPDCGGKTSGRP